MAVKKLWEKKEYLAICITIVLFIFVSVTSISSIHMLQGNARVVNYVGIVRGATQKLIKEEIMGWYLSQTDASFSETSEWYPDDVLIGRLDSIIAELLTGKGQNELVVLQDEVYLSNMLMVQAHWARLKGLIAEVRAGANPKELFESSQDYFALVNKTVFSAEAYSEAQVTRINKTLIFINILFVLFIIAGVALYWRSSIVKQRADALGKIAYIDPLTQVENRASCERIIQRLTDSPPDGDIAVFMFDMNNLKLTNDFLGHQGGDKVIAAFGAILKDAAKDYGFIGRFGGDEFLAVFEPGNKSMAESFLGKISEQAADYNRRREHKLEKIQYAAGYVIANPQAQNIDDIIHDADNRMYEDKRRSKGLI